MLAKLLVKCYGSIWSLKMVCQNTHSNLLKKLSIYIYEYYQYENSSSIAFNSQFLNEPCFPHGMKSIFISGDCKIGKNCVIFQQVTIGSIVLPDANMLGSPIIGDNCYIGAGAKIVGKVVIGNNVRIGANTVVYNDVPDNCVVVSAQQKNIIKSSELDNKFYSFRNKWMYFGDGKHQLVTDKIKLSILETIRK